MWSWELVEKGEAKTMQAKDLQTTEIDTTQGALV